MRAGIYGAGRIVPIFPAAVRRRRGRVRRRLSSSDLADHLLVLVVSLWCFCTPYPSPYRSVVLRHRASPSAAAQELRRSFYDDPRRAAPPPYGSLSSGLSNARQRATLLAFLCRACALYGTGGRADVSRLFFFSVIVKSLTCGTRCQTFILLQKFQKFV